MGAVTRLGRGSEGVGGETRRIGRTEAGLVVDKCNDLAEETGGP